MRIARRLFAVAAGIALMALPLRAHAETDDVCDQLAQVFFLIAKAKEQGETRESQVAWVREQFGDPAGSARSRLFHRAIDYIYASDQLAFQVRSSVRANCSVNERGQARVDLPGL